MTAPIVVAGAADLVGRGVHTALPPGPMRVPEGQDIVITGTLADAAGAALRLCAAETRITVVTPESGRTGGPDAAVRRQLRACRQVTLHSSTTVVWAVGLTRLEAVVLRHLPSGRVVVRNASALFILSSTEHQP